MWFLASVGDAAVRFSLPPGKDLVVGRKDCDILIQKDQSISRKHAVICVEEATKPSSIHLTDCKSKFGTHINGRKLSANERVELHHNDVIRFGQGPKESMASFKLIHESLVFCCSGMSGAEKARVKQLAKNLSKYLNDCRGSIHHLFARLSQGLFYLQDAQVVSNWTPECTHLIMNSVTVTVKVVSALASCRPIVTPAWLEEAVTHLTAGKVLPSCVDFLPDVVDGNIDSGSQGISFKPDYKRMSLLQDRVFFFLTEKQHTRLHLCLKSAGAQCRLTASPSGINMETMAARESVVVAVDGDVLSQMTEKERKWVGQVNTFLNSHGLRPVLDSEIGFALLHISTDKYCNPRSPTEPPDVSVPLPPPSLSQQAPFSMHPTSLPFTQESQLSPNVTVYALDTEATSQAGKRNMEDSTTQANTVKVDETVLHPPAVTSKEAIDSLFDFGGSFPPAEVRTKPSFGGPTRTERDDPGFKPPKPDIKSESSIVDDSQPESEVPVRIILPGLRGKSSDTSFLNKSEILAPQSVETVPSQDGSVLVPNSLTQESSGKKSLPDSELISALFKGKRRKRGTAEDSQEEPSQSEVKRKRLEDATAENGEEGMKRETGASIFSGLQSARRNRTKILDDSSRSNGSLHTKSIESKAHTPPRAAPPTESSIRPSSSEESMIIERTKLSTHEESYSTDVFKTPKRKKLHSISTPFLSTRKHYKSPREDGSGTDTPAAPPSAGSEAPEPPSATQATNTLTQNTIKGEMTSPFTCLSMPFGTTAGRRTKSQAVPTHADDIWNEEEDGSEGADGENPLGSQYPTQRMYKPVCTEDGFILPREKPKLRAPRAARLGMLASSDGLKEEEFMEVPPVDVTVVSLVVCKSGRERRRENGEDRERWRGRKNFKKFRKVQNVCTGIPRIVGVKEYVPEPSKTLQEWMEEREKEDEDDTREEESSQDLFRFTLPSKKRRT